MRGVKDILVTRRLGLLDGLSAHDSGVLIDFACAEQCVAKERFEGCVY